MSKLALYGGNPVRTKPFPVWPVYGKEESNALDRVLHSNVWGTLGAESKSFCDRFAKYSGSDHCVAVANGTVSLEIILRALGIGYGDEVILPPYSFNATLSSIIIVGATPVFVDIENDTYNIDPERIQEAITNRTRAIIPVHIGGRPANMDRISEIATRFKLYIIEDAAHAPGSEWRSRRVGSLGDVGSFSFQSSKNLCSGEGGAITTQDPDIFEHCWSIHHCGRAFHGTQWYSHPIIGTNARMTEWQAAILNAQIDRLDIQTETRMANASYLGIELSKTGFIDVFANDDRITRNAYHLYLFKYIGEQCKGLSRDAFIKAMNAEGVPCTSGYRCLYKQELLKTDTMKRYTGSRILYDKLYLPNAERATEIEGVWFTHNMLLGVKRDIDDIVAAAMKIYENSNELNE